MNGIKQHGKMFHKQQQQVAHIRPLPAAVAQHRLCSNQSISPTCSAHSSKLAAARVMLSAHAGTDRQMDGHHNIKFIVHRPSCAYYADTVPITDCYCNTAQADTEKMNTDVTFSSERVASIAMVVALTRLTSSTNQLVVNTSEAFCTAL